MLALWAHGALMALIGTYALLKERQELGCRGLGTAERQCRDEDSVYVRGTEPLEGDDRDQARRKLISVLSYHEKGGVWKRCFLIATVLAYLAHVVQKATRAAGAGWTIAASHLLFFAVIYFYWNFINYHHFRLLKQRGVQLVDALQCHSTGMSAGMSAVSAITGI